MSGFHMGLRDAIANHVFMRFATALSYTDSSNWVLDSSCTGEASRRKKGVLSIVSNGYGNGISGYALNQSCSPYLR